MELARSILQSPLDLTDNQKHWLVVGAALVGVVAPSLRTFLDAGLKTLYTTFKSSYGIDVQTSGTNLPWARAGPPQSIYKFINGNYNKKKTDPTYDYKVTSHVDLAKLYLRDLHTTNFTAINEECDPSAVLNLLESLPHLPGSGFTPAIQASAKNVREQVRNPWAHCDLNEWNSTKLENCFYHMDTLLRDCGLTHALRDLKEWKEEGGT